MLTPFKVRNLSSFKQATKYFLQMQSNPEWSTAVLSLTFDVKKKKKIPCFILCKQISYEIKGETPRKHRGHSLMFFKESIS